MKKSEEFLESKKFRDPQRRDGDDFVTLEHAKTCGKIVELEKEIDTFRFFLPSNVGTIQKLESEIERLTKS